MLLSALLDGSLAQWLPVLFVAAIAWRISRGGGGAAVSELSASNRVLEKRVHELGAEVRDLRIENAELRQRTDFGAVIAEHEARAQERHEGTLKVLNLIAARLGKERGEGE